jgi:hypothetical protein
VRFGEDRAFESQNLIPPSKTIILRFSVLTGDRTTPSLPWEVALHIAAATKLRILAIPTAMILAGPIASAAELPAYLQGIVGTSTSSAGEVATKNILQLNHRCSTCMPMLA